MPFGDIIGTFTISPLVQIGRKSALLFVDLVIIIGAVMNTMFNFWALIFGRFLIG